MTYFLGSLELFLQVHLRLLSFAFVLHQLHMQTVSLTFIQLSTAGFRIPLNTLAALGETYKP